MFWSLVSCEYMTEATSRCPLFGDSLSVNSSTIPFQKIYYHNDEDNFDVIFVVSVGHGEGRKGKSERQWLWLFSRLDDALFCARLVPFLTFWENYICFVIDIE